VIFGKPLTAEDYRSWSDQQIIEQVSNVLQAQFQVGKECIEQLY